MMRALLMLDFETTALDVEGLTVLEAAWAVCDVNGAQRSEIQQRFTAIPPQTRGGFAVTPEYQPAKVIVWPQRTGSANQRALDMAVESGLADEWIDAGKDAIIKTGGELGRLIRDTIEQHCAPDEIVYVAGSGVARFDYSILKSRCPAAHHRVHYRAVDTGVACTTLCGENTGEEIRAVYLTKGGSSLVLVAGSPYFQMDRTHGQAQEWVRGNADPHRAAADVARAIITQRALWELVGGPMRKLLGMESEPS
jgi:oligoribonuclease (3'-5' exoribonuclease)